MLASSPLRMACFDLDGTTVRPDGGISDAVRLAIRETVAAGVCVVLVSGRAPMGVLHVRESLGLAEAGGAYIAMNGAYAVDPDGAVFRDMRIPWPQTRDAAAALRAEGVHVSLFRGFDWWVLDAADEFSEHESFILQAAPRIVSMDDLNALMADGGGVNKCVAMAASAIVDRLRRDCALRFDGAFDVQRSGGRHLEFMGKGVSKLAAVEALAQSMGFGMDAVFAIGDNENDCALLERAGVGVAMGNADEAVKRAAGRVTAPNTEDGVALALRRYVL